jgi:hypothetical protein
MEQATERRDWSRLATWPIIAGLLAIMAISPDRARSADGSIAASDIILVTAIMAVAFGVVAFGGAAVRTVFTKRQSALAAPFVRLGAGKSLLLVSTALVAVAVKGYGYSTFPPVLYAALYIGLPALGVWLIRRGSSSTFVRGAAVVDRLA